jgi:hypothetical protein
MLFLQVDQEFELNKSGLWANEKDLSQEEFANKELSVFPPDQDYETSLLNPNWESE